MTELKQFLMWILRKALALPKRMHDAITESLGHEDWYFPFVLSILVVGMLGLGVGVVLHGIIRDTAWINLAAILSLTIWSVGLLFVLSAGIRAMHRAFRADQDKFFNKLKE